MRQGAGQVYFLSAPNAGLSAKLPLPVIPESMAIDLINLIPDDVLKKRGGTKELYNPSVTMTLDGDGIESLMPFVDSDGSSELIIAGNNTIVGDTIRSLNCTTAVTTDITGTLTVTNNRWQHIQFGGRLIICNGVDRVGARASGGNFASAGFTIGGGADSGLLNVGEYNERLYFVLADSQTGYYASTAAISGALTSYDFSSLFNRGGRLMWWGGLTNSVGDRNAELSVAISSEGEIRVFSGSYPGSTTWSKEGHYFIGRPIGDRAFFYRGGTLHVITEAGVVSLASVMGDPKFSKENEYAALSDNVAKKFQLYAKYFRDNFGWCGIDSPRHNLMLINVPFTDETQDRQLVMSTFGGGWCEFRDLNVRTMAICDGRLYLGMRNGVVLEYDDGLNDQETPLYASGAEAGYAITIKGETAFTGCGDNSARKGFLMIRPLIYVSSTTQLDIALNMDYERGATLAPVTLEGTGAVWDEAEWDVESWAGEIQAVLDWRSVEGNGFVANVAFEADVFNTDLEILGFMLQFRPGGIQ